MLQPSGLYVKLPPVVVYGYTHALPVQKPFKMSPGRERRFIYFEPFARHYCHDNKQVRDKFRHKLSSSPVRNFAYAGSGSCHWRGGAAAARRRLDDHAAAGLPPGAQLRPHRQLQLQRGHHAEHPFDAEPGKRFKRTGMDGMRLSWWRAARLAGA